MTKRITRKPKNTKGWVKKGDAYYKRKGKQILKMEVGEKGENEK